VTSNVCIDGTEGVVNQVDGSSLIYSSAKVHSLPLTAAQVRSLAIFITIIDTLLSNVKYNDNL